MENMNKNAYVNLATKGENRMASYENKRNDPDDQSEDKNLMGDRFLANMHDDFMISFEKNTRFKYYFFCVFSQFIVLF